MRIVFVIDEPLKLDGRKDSSVEIMRAALAAGDEIALVQRSGLKLGNAGLQLLGRRAAILATDRPWLEDKGELAALSCAFDLILMRLEPPVSDDYHHCCNLLANAERAGTPVFNRPASLLLFEEKISPLNYPALCPRTIISADPEQLLDFAASLAGGSVLKPLGDMGGNGVFAFAPGDSNLVAAINALAGSGRALVLQERLKEIDQGDRRVFIIAGEPAVLMLNRMPQAGSHLGNMAAGGHPQAMPLGAEERKIALQVGPDLLAAGVLFAGLDVIGGRLTEINITCPTGLRQVRDQTGVDLAAEVLRACKLAAQQRS